MLLSVKKNIQKHNFQKLSKKFFIACKATYQNFFSLNIMSEYMLRVHML